MTGHTSRRLVAGRPVPTPQPLNLLPHCMWRHLISGSACQCPINSLIYHGCLVLLLSSCQRGRVSSPVGYWGREISIHAKFGMAKFGAEKKWHQFLNTSVKKNQC